MHVFLICLIYRCFYLFPGVWRARAAARSVSHVVLLAKRRNAKTSTWQNTVPVRNMSLSISICRTFIILMWIFFKMLFFPPVFDQLDVISYEEVVQLPAFNRKTLVLIGEYGSVKISLHTFKD